MGFCLNFGKVGAQFFFLRFALGGGCGGRTGYFACLGVREKDGIAQYTSEQKKYKRKTRDDRTWHGIHTF